MPSFRAGHVHNEEKQRLAGDIQNVMALEVPLPSPPHNVPLAGFSPVRHWDGTGKGLSASILKIELRTASAIVIVAVDTLFLDEEFQVQLESRLSSNISLVLMASHTHFAPALARSVDALGGVDDGYYEAVLDCIANAIQSEVASRPVAMECFTSSTDLTINRRREASLLTMVNCDADRLILGRVFQWRKTRLEWLTQIFVASRFLILAGRQSPVSGRLRRTLFSRMPTMLYPQSFLAV